MAASYAEGDLCAAEGAGPTSSREEAIGRGQWVGDRRGFTRIPSRDGVASIPLFSDNGFTPHPSDSFGTGSNPMGLPGFGLSVLSFWLLSITRSHSIQNSLTIWFSKNLVVISITVPRPQTVNLS